MHVRPGQQAQGAERRADHLNGSAAEPVEGATDGHGGDGADEQRQGEGVGHCVSVASSPAATGTRRTAKA